MKPLTLLLIVFCAAAFGRPVEKLIDFELTDQHEKLRRYRFPKLKVTIMTISDDKGSGQLKAWIQRIYIHYGKRIDIDGIADVSTIPAPFRGMFRRAFKKELAYSVMLDWNGSVVRQFGYKAGVANLYVVDRQGRIGMWLSGAISDDGFRELTREIDQAIASTRIGD
jgi:hypothetical protein